jgi:hypothetical protein
MLPQKTATGIEFAIRKSVLVKALGRTIAMSIFCTIDDKHVPLFRILWISATPHFCGEEDCVREGYYEVRLEQGESLWANVQERDHVLQQIDAWQGGMDASEEEDW